MNHFIFVKCVVFNSVFDIILFGSQKMIKFINNNSSIDESECLQFIKFSVSDLILICYLGEAMTNLVINILKTALQRKRLL